MISKLLWSPVKKNTKIEQFQSKYILTNNKIDYNNLQSLTTVSETLNILPIKDKFIAFGWEYYECDGHDHSDLKLTFNKSHNSRNGKPKIIVANTIKGKGVSYMENKVEWHYKSPDETLLRKAINEIENAK